MKPSLTRFLLTSFLVCAAATAALADPPERVGRLGYIEGTVSTRGPGEDQWSPAALNLPATTGDAFWTEPNSRAEIQVGPAEIRMDNATELDLTQLDDSGTQLNVPQGVLNIHLHEVIPGGVHITTPAGTATLVQPGSYHIDAGNPAQGTAGQFAVLEGQADVTDSNGNIIEILPGEAAIPSGNPPVYRLEETNSSPFDDWALEREHREQNSQTADYVAPDMTGYQDLDQYGAWDSDPDYGPVWYPQSVASDWAPYRDGRWSYIQPWGWTWIDDAPWGFTPFHYGRWIHRDRGWAWYPGHREYHHVYAPALVTFVGGNGFSLTLASGQSRPGIGWVPLGPREAFHPYYPASPRYLQHLDHGAHHAAQPNHAFINRQAMTAIPADAFTHGLPVRHAEVQVPNTQHPRAATQTDIGHLQPAPGNAHDNAHDNAHGNFHAGANTQTQTQTPQAPSPQHPAAATITTQSPPADHPPHGAPGPARHHDDIRRQPQQNTAAPANMPQPRNIAPMAAPAIATPGPQPYNRTPATTPSRPLHTETPHTNAFHPPASQPHDQSHPHIAPISHPVQKTHIQPTPRGWTRTQSTQHTAPMHPDNRKP